MSALRRSHAKPKLVQAWILWQRVDIIDVIAEVEAWAWGKEERERATMLNRHAAEIRRVSKRHGLRLVG